MSGKKPRRVRRVNVLCLESCASGMRLQRHSAALRAAPAAARVLTAAAHRPSPSPLPINCARCFYTRRRSILAERQRQHLKPGFPQRRPHTRCVADDHRRLAVCMQVALRGCQHVGRAHRLDA